MAALLQTTIAGSLPKPEWLSTPGVLWAPWLLEGEALAEGKRDAVRLALFDQEHGGIDIVTDGEQTRRHFVTTLIENLDGVDFEHRQTVRIRNRYDAAVPVVVGPVARRAGGQDAFVTRISDSTGGNQIDTTDFFVHQQYLDFLNREPDPSGFAFWTSNITCVA